MLTDEYRRTVENDDWAGLAALYADDAVIDMNVPAWRYQRRGGTAAAEVHSRSYGGGPHRIDEFTVHEGPFGAVVEVGERLLAGTPRELYVRSLHVFETRDGRISRHTAYCTGPWDKETVARQAMSAPMVEAQPR